MGELTANNPPASRTNTTSKTIHNQQAGPAMKPTNSSNQLQRQPTGQQQTGKGKVSIPEDDLDALMADLVPTAANKGRQSSMPQQQNQPRMSDVSELDNLMADLAPPTGKKNAGRPNHRPSVSADLGNDLDDVINNLQSDYGMVEAAPPRAQKTSTFQSNNHPNNNPHAVYNPPNNNPHGGYNNNQSGYNQNTYNNPNNYNQNPASRTNTNQPKPVLPEVVLLLEI
jgi:hypothetical protein